MTLDATVTIAVDVLGGDRAPGEIMAGAAAALDDDHELHLVLAGPEEVVAPLATACPDRVETSATSVVIGMDEHPATAIRAKKDASVVVCAGLVRAGRADGFFSAGSTGAAMAAATLCMGRLQGVQRPAIATVLPTAGPPCVLLDAGANADSRAEYLLQFAHMGGAYAAVVLGVDCPRVGLLNIGEEDSKGSALAREAHKLLAEQVPGFVGNIEGTDVLAGKCDVIVTDGFTGNVVLKLLEGASRVFFTQVHAAVQANVLTQLAGSVLRPSLRSMKRQFDPETYGGAPLLGVDGVCIIGHGSSSARAVSNGIRVAAQAARGKLPSRIAAAVAGN